MSALYQKCISVMLEQWDATRRISRRNIVKDLTPEIIQDILSDVALEFHNKRLVCFNKLDLIDVFKRSLPKYGIEAYEAGNVLAEISAQHGLIVSWAVDDLYAFPHLAFQEYLAAKALRDRALGFEELLGHKEDPFWQNTIKLYSGMGDVTDLIRGLVTSKDNILHSSLFLAAKCLSEGKKVTDIKLRKFVIKHLIDLTKDKHTYFKIKAVELLVAINDSEASSYLKSIIREESGSVDIYSPALKFIIFIEGESAVQDIVNEILKNEYALYDLFSAMQYLPQKKALPILKDLITSNEYIKEDFEHDRGIRHRRNDAVRMLAKIGEDDAIPILCELVRDTTLTNYTRETIVQSLANIKNPRVTRILKSILNSEYLPTDCRVKAAYHLGPNDLQAKEYLLTLVSDEKFDVYDRRDAVSALKKFNLYERDIPSLKRLLFDTGVEFWGGPAIAAEVIRIIDSEQIPSILTDAHSVWSKCNNPSKIVVMGRIEEELILHNSTIQIKDLLESYDPPNNKPMNFDLVNVLITYYELDPKGCTELCIKSLHEYQEKYLYGGYLISAVVDFLEQMPISKPIIIETINLALRMPSEKHIWSILEKIWLRRDLTSDIRTEFVIEKGE